MFSGLARPETRLEAHYICVHSGSSSTVVNELLKNDDWVKSGEKKGEREQKKEYEVVELLTPRKREMCNIFQFWFFWFFFSLHLSYLVVQAQIYFAWKLFFFIFPPQFLVRRELGERGGKNSEARSLQNSILYSIQPNEPKRKKLVERREN